MAGKNKKIVNLSIDGESVIDFDLIPNSMGTEYMIPGSNLRTASKQHLGSSVSFFDPGYSSVASCKSEITYVDGEKGQLFYRGFAIEDLADKYNFMDIAYLLNKGSLPNKSEVSNFSEMLKSQDISCDKIHKFISAFDKTAHPMSIIMSVISAASSLYKSVDIHSEEDRWEVSSYLMALVPIVAAMSYRYLNDLPYIEADFTLGYADNFLNMMLGESENNEIFARALDKIFTLHADHEQNASTSTVRIVGSTLANPFACIASGVAALWGSAHGGANEACLKMLEDIGNVSNIDECLERVKNPDDDFRLMGFGHRVYRTHDPRANIMRDICHDVLGVSHGGNDNLYDLALKLEKIALHDEYFVSRKLYPNVDFYSGITLNAIGLPLNMFTPIFVIGRLPGWLAHWSEMHSQPGLRISRPRQHYVGKTPQEL
jgi:citrate synthase